MLFNKGLSQIYLGRNEQGISDMREAQREKATEEHNVIDDAIQDRGEGYTVFSIPVGVLYRPSENKLKNSKRKDYLGKAKLVAASDASEAYTAFTGVTRRDRGMTPQGVAIDQDAMPPSAPLARSQTVPAPRDPDVGANTQSGGALARAKTTQAVLENVRARASEGDVGVAMGSPAGLGRSNTSIGPNRVGLPMTRGLSVRKPDAGVRSPPAALSASPPPPPEKAGESAFFTRIVRD